jgi:hypothetical protein
MTSSENLRENIRLLSTKLQTKKAHQTAEKERRLTGEALSLLQIEARRLDDLLAGQSRLPSRNVYLSIWTLNKGFQEVGGSWLTDQELSSLAAEITHSAMALARADGLQ